MSLLRVPIYPTRNLAVEIDPGARSIVAGTNVSFTTNPDDSITINASGGTGTVTSVGLAAPTGFSVSGSPVTTSGTLTLAYAAGYTGYTTAEKTKLAGIASGAQPGTVTSVGATGSTGLTVGGSPITTSGTLTFTLSANLQSWSGIAPATKLDVGEAWTRGFSSNGTRVTSWSSGGDLDLIRGFHALYANGTANRPSTGNGVVWGLSQTIGGTDYGVQEWGQNNRRFFRTIFNDVWGPWQEYYHTGNLPAVLGSYVLKAGDTMTGQLLRTIAGMANNTDQLWLRAYSDNSAGEVSISYVRGAASFQGGINFNVANGAANNVTPLRLTPATGIPVFTTRVHNMTGAVNAQSILRYMGWNNEVNRWAEVMESDATLSLYSYDSSGGAADRIMNLIGSSMGTKQVTITGARLVVDQGDLYTYRTGGTTGVIFLNSSGSRYLFYDGSKYVMPGAGLNVGGYIWPSASVSGSKKLSKISIGTAAPSGLIDGELYLRY